MNRRLITISCTLSIACLAHVWGIAWLISLGASSRYAWTIEPLGFHGVVLTITAIFSWVVAFESRENK